MVFRKGVKFTAAKVLILIYPAVAAGVYRRCNCLLNGPAASVVRGRQLYAENGGGALQIKLVANALHGGNAVHVQFLAYFTYVNVYGAVAYNYVVAPYLVQYFVA